MSVHQDTLTATTSSTMPVTQDTSTPLYEIREVTGKGKGVFATHVIPCGTRIIAEKPLIQVSTPYSNSSPLEVEVAVARLSQQDRDKYMSLTCSSDSSISRDSRAFGILQTNCFSSIDGKSVICHDACRINHSCTPNCYFSWNVNLEQETIHAMVDIQQGEELTISYIGPHPNENGYNLYGDAKARQASLKSYGFICSCAACLSPASDIRRGKMFALDQAFAWLQPSALFAYGGALREVALESPSASDKKEKAIQCFEISIQLKNLLEVEGLKGPLFRVYEDAAWACFEKGKKKDALKWAQARLNLLRNCVGEDSEQYEIAKESVERYS